MFEYWGKRDPIGLYEAYLELRGVRRSALEEVEDRVILEIDVAEQEALRSREKNMPLPSALTEGVYADRDGA